jgi:hypothetical protein
MILKINWRLCHIALWMWLARNPYNYEQRRWNTKMDWPGWKTLDIMIRNKTILVEEHVWKETMGCECFACGYTIVSGSTKMDEDGSQRDCERCPCFTEESHSNMDRCMNPLLLFKKWGSCFESPEKRGYYARSLAELWK